MDLRVCSCWHWVCQRRILSRVWQVALNTACHGGPYGPVGGLQIRGARHRSPGEPTEKQTPCLSKCTYKTANFWCRSRPWGIRMIVPAPSRAPWECQAPTGSVNCRASSEAIPTSLPTRAVIGRLKQPCHRGVGRARAHHLSPLQRARDTRSYSSKQRSQAASGE